jgi:hypothetical protein
MGLTCSPDVYQEKMSELFIDMISVIVYQDDILVLTSGSFDNHLRQLGNVFKWLHQPQQPSSQCQKVKLLHIGHQILRLHTYHTRYQTATTKGQCNPSGHKALQCEASPILWHQGREIIAIVPLENGAFCTIFSANFHKF